MANPLSGIIRFGTGKHIQRKFMEKRTFLQKTKNIFVGKRSLKERLWTAFWPALILTFILLFFGPLDLSHIASDYVNYSVLHIFSTCLLVWGIAFAALFLLTWLPGGKLHVWLSSLWTGLALAFYIQGNWLNIDLGTLDGSEVDWGAYGDNAAIGLVIFILIVLIPFLLHYYSRKLWKRFVIFVPALLLIMQMVPLTMMLIREYRDRPSDVHYIMEKDKEFTLGQENIVVFILDLTNPTHISKMLKKFPEALDPFHDFTCFDNYNTIYMGTFPASCYLLTHYEYDWNIPIEKWFDNAWHSETAESFYNQMQAAGWESRVFNAAAYAAGTLENEYGKISNVKRIEEAPPYTINPSAFRKLIKLSFYRYFPLIMKAPFRIYTGELNKMRNLPDNEQPWNKIDSVLKYMDQRLAVEEEGKVYVTYHWIGAHDPYYFNEFAQRKAPTQQKQLAGQLYAISQYIQQMKDYHIYDSSTIIITSDHGDLEHPSGILYIKPAGQRQDKMTHLQAPVSQSEFMETVAEAAGLEKGQFGTSVFDIPEDEPRERCTYIRWRDVNYQDIPGKGTNAIQEYCYIGDDDTVNDMIVEKQYKSYPIADAWY